MDKLTIETEYNKIGLNASKYSEFLSQFTDTYDLEWECGHHIFIRSIFGYEIDNLNLAISSEDHTRCHRLLIEDNLGKFESGDITEYLIKAYKSFDVRFNRTYSNYEEDIEWYKTHLKFFADCFYKFLGKELPPSETDIEWYHHSALSAINYYFNKDMVQKMKENSVYNGDKQRWKTIARNVKGSCVNRILRLHELNLPLTRDNFISLFDRNAKTYYIPWWNLLSKYGYYLLKFGLPRSKFDELVATGNEIRADKIKEDPSWYIEFKGFNDEVDVYPRIDKATEEILFNYLSNQ